MKKKMIALAVAAAFAAPLAAQAGVDVYGQIQSSYGLVDDSTNTAGSEWMVRSHASRLGFKGSQDLDGGLKAVYKLEYGVDPDTKDSASITSRNQYVGLAGDWGTVLLGRHDTPTKMSQGKFDQFGDNDGDFVGVKGVVQMARGDLRENNVLAFVSPKYDAFSFAAAIESGEDAAGGNDGPADTVSVAGMYDANNLYVALGYDSYSNDDALLRLTATYKMDAIMLGGVFEQYSADAPNTVANKNKSDQNLFGLSGAYTMGKNTLKAQLIMATENKTGAPKADGSATDSEKTSYSLGVDHKLGDKTTAYAQYTALQDKDGANDNIDYSFVGVGILHKF